MSSSLDDLRERAQHIDANHMAMTRFPSRDDPGYRKVGGELCHLVEDIRERLEDKLRKERERPDSDDS